MNVGGEAYADPTNHLCGWGRENAHPEWLFKRISEPRCLYMTETYGIRASCAVTLWAIRAKLFVVFHRGL